MYEEHPDISTPPDETVIWRYMDLERLLSLLCDKSLFMCRIDKFRDPWEGAWPASMVERLRSAAPRTSVQGLSDNIERLKRSFFVNCWHAGEHESAALWDSYAGRAGLAIKSTCGRLKSAINCESPVYVGEVSYQDYSGHSPTTSPSNVIVPALLKRKSFEHEREVRALIWDASVLTKKTSDQPAEAAGRDIRVDLARLIDAIYLSPTSPNWLLRYVQTLISKFDVQGCNVIRSQLYDDYVL